MTIHTCMPDPIQWQFHDMALNIVQQAESTGYNPHQMQRSDDVSMTKRQSNVGIAREAEVT
ncbi:hypothetical protein GCM10008938_39150 [Deinococcus roseus]|uniref:Uncharacterized protein n=1 Tax=Deinococcus roseus TaxID=392414 RepID=A0ABQ2D838_9DEIO|nr:hypothetical protein GCM10008938_39150 [Deinococcus roseus]